MSRSTRREPFDLGICPAPVEETRLESVEELRRSTSVEPPGYLIPTVKEHPAEPDTLPYRPVRRPPMALLCILDDGQADGEWVRIRGDRLAFGRTDGDIRIPHDSLMSGRHAELVREAANGIYRWYLNDLKSTNGTFVRVAGAVLNHGQDLLVGSRRLRFEAAPQGVAPADPAAPVGTSAWQAVSLPQLIPSLVEVTHQGPGQRYPLSQAETWIGRDPAQCSVVLADDLMASPRHARVYRDAKNRWRVENAGARNGVWLCVTRQAVAGTGQFQLGEQRFLLRVLS